MSCAVCPTLSTRAVFKIGNIRRRRPFDDRIRVGFDLVRLRVQPEQAPDDICPDGTHTVGHFAIWPGKVNVHASLGERWRVDADCRSGANHNALPYCRKFWPEANQIVPMAEPAGARRGRTAELKPFSTGGCGTESPSIGHNQYACCEPD